MWKHCGRVLAAILVTATLSAGVAAQTFNEVGDAGQTLATAQVVPGGVTVIQGNLQTPGDVDLYRFSLSTAGRVTIRGWSGTYAGSDCSIDSNLILFNSAGEPLWGDDDGDPENCVGSQIELNLPVGYFLIAYGGNDIEALDANGDSICGNDDGECVDASSPLGSFDSSGDDIGSYVITFSQSTGGVRNSIAAVPGPTGLLLLPLLAVIGFVGSRTLKRRA